MLKSTFQKDLIPLQALWNLQFSLYPVQIKANWKNLFSLPKQGKWGTHHPRRVGWWDISTRPVSPSAKAGGAVGSSDIKPPPSCVALSANGNRKQKKDLLSCLKSSYPTSQSQGPLVIWDRVFLSSLLKKLMFLHYHARWKRASCSVGLLWEDFILQTTFTFLL